MKNMFLLMMAILHILSIIVNWKQLLQISFHEIEGKIRQTLILCKTLILWTNCWWKQKQRRWKKKSNSQLKHINSDWMARAVSTTTNGSRWMENPCPLETEAHLSVRTRSCELLHQEREEETCTPCSVIDQSTQQFRNKIALVSEELFSM